MRWKHTDPFTIQRNIAVLLNPKFKDLNFFSEKIKVRAYTLLKKIAEQYNAKIVTEVTVESEGQVEVRPTKCQKVNPKDVMKLLYGDTLSKSKLIKLINL